MKNISRACIAFVLLVLFPVLAKAQEEETALPKNIVKINVLGALAGSYTLAYERMIDDRSSAQLSFGYRKYSFEDSIGNFNYKYSGFVIIPEYRYYVTHENTDAPQGMYLAPFIRIGLFTGRFNEYNADGVNYSFSRISNSVTPGVMLGYQWIVSDRIAVDLFGGLQYKVKFIRFRPEDNGLMEDDPYYANLSFGNAIDLVEGGSKSTLGLRLGINAGFAF